MPFDAIQAVDLAFDAPINEIDLSKGLDGNSHPPVVATPHA